MIGTDIVYIPRMRKALASEAFVMRVFTEQERAYCDGRPDPISSYAGLFCAKEAAIKAFKSGFGGGIMPSDVEITHADSGAPEILLHGKAAEKFAADLAEVSISHDGDYAIAVVALGGGRQVKYV